MDGRILLDIEVQRDLFLRGGSCYERSASKARRMVYSLFGWAKAQQVPVISTLLRVRRSERGPLSRVPHCVDGSDGERKLARTVLHDRINLGLRNTTDLPDDLLQRHRQVIFEKRHTDIFLHARAERLITQLDGGTFVVCGAGTAKGIVEAVVGLRTRGFAVIVASDAVLDLRDPLAEMAWKRMEAKGALLLSTPKIIASMSAPVRAVRTPQVGQSPSVSVA